MVRGALLLSAGLLAWVGSARAADEEPPIPGDGAREIFLRSAHDRIHNAWVLSFLRNTRERLPPSHPVNGKSRSAVVAVTVIPDGIAIEALIEKSSGSAEFDAAALDLFRDISLPQPPDTCLSDDGRAHLRWVFARDERQCSGVTVVMRE